MAKSRNELKAMETKLNRIAKIASEDGFITIFILYMVKIVNTNEKPVAGKPHGGFCEGRRFFTKYFKRRTRCLLDKQ